MKHVILTATLSALLSVGVLLASESTAPKPVELHHFWISSGEKAAVNEIRKAVEARGASFKDVAFKNAVELNARVTERIALGYPPAMMHWMYGGKQAEELLAMGAIRALPDAWRGQPLEDVLLPEVFHETVHKNKLSSIPMGIHLQNTAFYNAAIYRELNLALPQNWSEFLQQAPVIQEAGYTPIALSDEWWQLRILFNTLLLDQLGAQDYLTFRRPDTQIAQWKPELIKALEILHQLRRFAGEGYQGRRWDEATQMVVQGKAAMQAMPDWVKGEFTAAGLVAGEDYFCSLSPNADNLHIYVIDNFAMLNIKNEQLLEGQELLLDTILDPEVQLAFNNKKGSMPVRYGVPAELLDDCTRQNYQQWASQNEDYQRVPEMLQARSTFIGKALHRAWQSNEAVEDTAARIIKFAGQQAGIGRAASE